MVKKEKESNYKKIQKILVNNLVKTEEGYLLSNEDYNFITHVFNVRTNLKLLLEEDNLSYKDKPITDKQRQQIKEILEVMFN
jgi:hypothetical protein